jgi:hypothetical protein
VTDTNGTTTGTVAVGSKRNFEIKGYVDTSHGRVETTVEQTVNFLNTQTVDVNPNVGPDDQDVVQTTTVDSVTTSRTGFLVEKTTKHFSYPLTLNYVFVYNPDGSYTQTVTSSQKDIARVSKAINGFEFFKKKSDEEVNSTDVLQFDSSFNLTAAGIGNSSASYTSKDSDGGCYSRSLTAANQVLTSVTDGKGCKDHDDKW